MDLSTIRGIAKARWWVLVAAALIAVSVSGRLTDFRNDHLPQFEAVTSITFIEDPQALEREDFVSFLENQFALAQDVNSDVLDETPGAFIPWLLAEVDLETDQNQIQFIGRGYTEDEAQQLALAMRERFLAASTIGAGQQRMSEELDEITDQIAELRLHIATAQQAEPLSTEEQALQTRRFALEARIAALRARYGNLGVELLNPVLRPEPVIRGEMERVFNELVAVEQELATIPLPPTVEQLQAGDEQALLDQLRLQQLETRWQQLYLGQRELQALATVGTVDTQPVSLDPSSARGNQTLALFGALVAAMIGLVALDRARGLVWSGKEIEEGPPILTELPPRSLRTPVDQPWYAAIHGGRRKAAIQMLRSQVDNLDNAVLAIQGTGVHQRDIRELAADLATSVAVSGRSVLLIDTAFDHPNNVVEFGSDGGPTLSRLLHLGSDDPEEAASQIKTALLGGTEVVRGLHTLQSGNGNVDPADALAGYRFELLLDVAREGFDLVIVSGTEADEPASHVLAQRIDAALLVGSAGHTIGRAVEAAGREFSHRRARLLGLVLLRRRPSRLRRWVGARWALSERSGGGRSGARTRPKRGR